MTALLTGAPFLAAKFAVPSQAPGLIRRQRLLNRLTRGAQGPLTLITGSAGAGKTVLAATWARSQAVPGPLLWLTLDEDDTPGTFWAYLTEGLRRSGVPAGDRGPGTPAGADDAERSLLVRLVSALERAPGPLVLVVDGLDRVPGTAVQSGLRFVAEHAGPDLRMVLIGREEPPLPLHRYRAEGRVHEIGERELAFTRPEAAQLLRPLRSAAGARHRRTAPDDHLADLLWAHTEGWAAGLRLCALAAARSEDPDGFARSSTAAEQAVSDYLRTEVLAVQPEPDRELLLRTGVLGRVHPDLAAALTGRADSGRILEGLARRHAFVAPVPGTRWYRFHPLFAQVLRTHLRSGQPELEPLLHSRAARWYARRGRTAEAVDEAAAGGDWGFAAEQTVQHLMVGPMLSGLGALPSADTFSRMPDDTPGTAPALVAAACCLARQDAPGCRSRLARVASAPDGADPAPEPADRLTAALLRLLSTQDGVAEQAAQQVAELMAAVPPEERVRHPEIEPLRRYGQACARQRDGRLQEARDGFEQALRACSGDATALLRHRCLGRLALADAAAGALGEGGEHATASLETAGRYGIPDTHRSGAADLALAAVALEREDLTAAAVHLDRAEPFPDTRHDPDLVAERAVLRARLDVARGLWDAALTHLAGQLDGPAASSPWSAARLAVAYATAALARGDAGAAAAALDRAPGAAGLVPHTVALAQVHAAAGQQERALELVESAGRAAGATLPDRVRLGLLRAHRALEGGDGTTARLLLGQALDTARPERLRRPFREAGPWVRHVAAGLDRHSGAYDWLDAPPAGVDGIAVQELSPREREVLRLVARMMSTEEVAAELRLSANTVKTHLRGIYRKLCVSRRRDAVERARELHML